MSTEKPNRFSVFLDRIKIACNASTDAEIAKILGMRPSTFSERKRNQSIPYEEVIRFSEERGIQWDWLFGKPEVESCCLPHDKKEVLEAAMEVLDSGTIHATALKHNIMAFQHAVRMEKNMTSLMERMAGLEMHTRELIEAQKKAKEMVMEKRNQTGLEKETA